MTLLEDAEGYLLSTLFDPFLVLYILLFIFLRLYLTFELIILFFTRLWYVSSSFGLPLPMCAAAPACDFCDRVLSQVNTSQLQKSFVCLIIAIASIAIVNIAFMRQA